MAGSCSSTRPPDMPRPTTSPAATDLCQSKIGVWSRSDSIPVVAGAIIQLLLLILAPLHPLVWLLRLGWRGCRLHEPQFDGELDLLLGGLAPSFMEQRVPGGLGGQFGALPATPCSCISTIST